eukprot:scaffold273178_cov24-Tisochrysis_lutea.AAC.1
MTGMPRQCTCGFWRHANGHRRDKLRVAGRNVAISLIAILPECPSARGMSRDISPLLSLFAC